MTDWISNVEGIDLTFADNVLTITINRPQFRNALAKGMAGQIAEIMTAAQQDESVRCVIFRGEGEHFSAGGDIAGFRKSLEQAVDERRMEFQHRLEDAARMVTAVQAFTRPLIASVRGGVAGAALVFPLAADMVICDDTASFVFAHTKIGLVPDGGVSYFLPRVVGERTARRLLLSGAAIGARDAQKLGLVDTIVAPTELEGATAKAARSFARASQSALSMTKQMISRSTANNLEQQLVLETEGIVESVGSADFEEGVKAFLEKRPAVFSGKD